MDVIEGLMNDLKKYAEDNDLYDTNKTSVASITHKFYATIPEDMIHSSCHISHVIGTLFIRR
jgi:hypothetical protein